MRKTACILFVFSVFNFLHAQKEADNWYFGNKAGITFRTNPPTALTNGQLSTLEGCATISNSAGRLLFYTDGITAYDSTHSTMSNGTGLKGHSSSTQSAIIVPRPDSAKRYYIFTVDATNGSNGAQYSEVDMKLNSGRGAINSTKNVQLLKNTCEKITAVKHANGIDYWVLTHRYNTDTIFAFLVTAAGVSNTPVKSATKMKITGNTVFTLGYMKVSPDGRKIAYANYQMDSAVVANFNSSTGVVSNAWVFTMNDGYGLEFSPQAKYLYIGDFVNKKISQFDLSATTRPAFIASRRVVDSTPNSIGALQLGPDGKIYISVYVSSGTGYLYVIHAPDSAGFACRPQKNYVNLSGRVANYGLPTFIQSYFRKKTFSYVRNCIKDTTFFNLSDLGTLDSVKWNFGDTASGIKNTSKLKTGIWHIYNKTGNYQVKLVSYFQDKRDTTTAIVYVKDPKPKLGKDTSICNKFKYNLTPHKSYLTYKWNTDSTRKTLVVSAKGTYILTAKDTVGCVSSDTIVFKNPIAKTGFILSDTVRCFRDNIFSMKDTSKYKDDAWKKSTWFFGNGGSKVDTVGKISYLDTGKYKIKLVLLSKENCKDSLTRTVVVNPNPKAGFSINKGNQCFNGHGFNLTNTTTISKGTMTYSWQFGDDSVSTKKDIVGKKYLKDSSYNIRLIISSDKSCRDTINKTVTVYPNTKVLFTPSVNSQCFRSNTNDFSNTSTIRTGLVSSYTWTFGDNTSSSQKSISGKTYSTADSFKVMLLAISDKGCRDSLTKSVYVWANSVPGFSINKPIQCFNGHNFNFTNTSTISKGSMSHDWTLGDNNSSSTMDISNKTYLIDSTYNIRLIVTSDRGCKDTISKTVTVHPNSKPKFTASVSSQCFNFNRTGFVNNTVIRTGSVASYTWNFGDNTGSNQKDISKKVYGTADSFLVSLLAISDKGCRDSISSKVYIWHNTNIGFSINKDTQCYEWHKFSYTNSSTLSKGSMTFAWDLGDGGTATDTNILNKHYTSFGVYPVTLVTTTDRNCKDTLVKKAILHASPKVGFNINKSQQCIRGNRFDFINTSIIDNGMIANYDWNLGNSQTKTSQHVNTYSYTSHDSFTVRLIETSDNGCRDTIAKKVYVWDNPTMGFNINKDTQCFEWNRFSFANMSVLNKGSMTYEWDFGDTKTDTAKSIILHRYASYGTYPVKLITTTDRSCKDTIIKIVRVNASPVSKFSIDKDRQCFRGNKFSFSNTTSINEGVVSSQEWDLGDGQTRTTTHVANYAYLSEDSFDIRLINVSDRGCRDTSTDMTVTHAQPVAKFSILNDSQCWQKHYFVINNHTGIKYGSMKHSWDFGDASSDTSFQPITKSYANKSARYSIFYKATSQYGCIDSMRQFVTLLERPISLYDVNDSIQCFKKHLFSFTNKTTFSAMNTLAYFWDYGNGNTSTGITPQTSTYPQARHYPVTLVSYSSLTNCYDTFVSYILTAPHSVPDFSIDKDSQCFRFNQFGFVNKSTIAFGSMSYQWDFRDNSGSTVKDPQKHYTTNAAGHLVKLVVTSDRNCSDSIEKPVVLIPHPKASFAINDTAQCLNNHAFDLTNTTTLAYGSFSGKWLFDDATNSTNKDVSAKQFTLKGMHKVTMTITSGHNCTDTTSRWVFLEKPGNTSILLSDNDSQCLRGNSFNFAGSSSDPSVSFVTYNWDFGDASTSLGNPAKYSYKKDGSAKVLLETISANGCRDSAYQDVVLHPHPVSSFTATSPCFPETVDFTNTSSLSKGTITSYKWDLGDGTISTLQDTKHRYAASGFYKITLISTSNYGCNDTMVKDSGAHVRNKPVALFDFTTLPTTEFELTTLKLRNKSTTDVVSSNWDFGNGFTSTDYEPQAEYRDSGSKWINLIVTNNENCKDTFRLKTGQMITDFFFNLPTAFSPNGSGVNDIFKPVATPFVFSYVMEIYNRWGEKVFESRDLSKGWDGTYMGEPCMEGVYLCRVYVVPLKGKLVTREITVTLLR